MQNIDNRLDSFKQISKPKSKAKPQFPLSTESHPHLSPRALAEAGFYHTPGSSAASHDNCTCFLCDLELGGWDDNDDPFEEHAKRAGCAWAEMVCAVKIEKRKRDRSDGRYVTVYETPNSLPQSAESIEVRVHTFKKWWPHKQKAGWLPSVKALARAGFVYNPSTESKDSVICPYCEYGVEGWEATDDPWQIHQSKVPDCHFFRAALVGESSATEEKSKASRSAKSAAAPRRTRRGTTAVSTQASDHPEQSEQSEAEQEVPTAQASNANRKATKPRATTTTKKVGRGRKNVLPEPELDTEPELQAETETEAEPEVVESRAESHEEEPAPAKKTRGRPKTTNVKKPRATTAKGRGKAKTVEEETQSEADKGSEMEVVTENEVEPEAESPPPSEAEVAFKDEPTPKAVKPRKAPSRKTADSQPKPPSQTSKPSSRAGSSSQAQPPSRAESSVPTRPPSQASKPSSKPQTSRAKPLPALPPTSPSPSPRPLSQLDRFANIPPSSPVPTPSRNKATLRSAQPAKPSPAVLSREDMDSSLTRGALAVRQVVEQLSSPGYASSRDATPHAKSHSPLPGSIPKEASQPKPLSEEQRNMTVEDLVRFEIRKGYEELMREGEETIGRWEARTKAERKKIEGL